jgi:type IV pilus assembly protein PilA
MLSRLNRKEGFTLIELMIVIAIIGILAAIAIPQFSAYRTRSYNSAAQSDLRNMATAQEAYYVDESRYCNTVGTLASGTYGYQQSTNVTVDTAGTVTDYTISAYHISGDKTYSMQGPGGTVEAAS